MKAINLLALLLLGLALAQCNHDELPSIKITSPAKGSKIVAGDTITILIDVDNEENIQKIELYIDTLHVETVCCGNYYFKFRPAYIASNMHFDPYIDLGEHTIIAKAYDKQGNQAIDESSFEIILDFNKKINTYPPLIISSHQVELRAGTYNASQWGFYLSDSIPGAYDKVFKYEKNIYSSYNTIAVDSLKSGTKYYCKAWAIVDSQEVTGNTVSFETKKETKVVIIDNQYTDPRDNKTYKTVTIGNQTWMAENLAYLPEIFHPLDVGYGKPRYFVYDYYGIYTDSAKITSNYKKYGVLYNWPAAFEACPIGWHLPTTQEWEQLRNYIENNNKPINTYPPCYNIAMHLKDKQQWDNNYPAYNTYGFSALPAGFYNREFGGIGKETSWWASTGQWCFALPTSSNCAGITNFNCNETSGHSVRCIKD